MSGAVGLGIVLLALRFKLHTRLSRDVLFLLVTSLGALFHTLLATGPVHNLWAIAGLTALTVGTGHLSAARLELRTARPVLMGVLAVVAVGLAVMGVLGAVVGLEWGGLLVVIIAFHGFVRPAREADTLMASWGSNGSEPLARATHRATAETLEVALLMLYLPLGALLSFLHLKLALIPAWQAESSTSAPPHFVAFGLWFFSVLVAYVLVKLKNAELNEPGRV